MNIKSLLLGSAAALVAVTGARAADAVVVAEPEPAEYVKICDVYGAGYFYIPGTETCLRIGGYIRYDIGVGKLDGVTDIPDQLGDGFHDGYYKNARFALKTWTGQETELGTLKTYTEMRFQFGNKSGSSLTETSPGSGIFADNGNWQAKNKSVSLNFAWIQLGGLRIGKDETAWDTFSGYAGDVINDSIVGYGGPEFDTNLIQYQFDAGNGFSAVVSLEEGANAYTIDSYVPHVVGGVKYTQGWGSISATGAYDSAREEWAAKVRLDVKPMDALSLFAMVNYGSEEHGTRNFFKNWDGNWAVFVGGTYTINEKTKFNAQASYDEGKTLGLAANVAYDVVPGFTVIAEVDYMDRSSNSYHASDDAFGGILRFQRSF